MGVFSNFVNLIKPPRDTVPRSFENLLSNYTDNGSNGCGECLDFESQMTSVVSPKDKISISGKDHPIFANNSTTIGNKVIYTKTYFTGPNENIARELQNRLELIGFDTEFKEELFYHLYDGYGACLVILFDGKLKIVPFWNGSEELVRIHYTKVGSVKSINLKSFDDYGQWVELDTDNAKWYLMYNMKQANRYVSNLTLAIPYILLSNQMLKADLYLAKNNYTKEAIVTPLISDITPKSNEMVIGGRNVKIGEFLTGSWLVMAKQLKNLVFEKGLKFLPFEAKVTPITLNNMEMQSSELRKYLDEKITISCFSTGSISGRDGTANKAVANQDRSNLEEITFTYFQNKIKQMVDDFVTPLILPQSYSQYSYQFYSEETDITISLRNQSTALLQVLSSKFFPQLLADTGLKINRDDLSTAFSRVYGIKLDKVEITGPTVNPAPESLPLVGTNPSISVREEKKKI
jgi:hypothetical protein